MIGKVTCGASFSGLGAYLTKDQDRVAWINTRCLASRDVQEVIREMHATAGLSSRCQKPVYHLSLSFDAEDHPVRVQMEEACDAVLQDLGLEGHQVLLVAHSDTDYPHVHMMVNRVHPKTGRAWSNSHDYRKIERTLRRLEQEHGYRRVTERSERSRTLRRGEVREMYRTGEIPFVLLARDVAGKPSVTSAGSWRQLTMRLQKVGLRMEARPRGMVLTDGYRYVAASRVSKALSRYQLERRYGQTLPSFLAGDKAPVAGRGHTRGSKVGRSVVRTGSNHRDTSDVMLRHGVELIQETALRMALQLFADDGLLRGLYVDVRICEAVQEQDRALSKARQSCHALRHRLQGAKDQDLRIQSLSEAFDRELGKAYRDPVAVRQAFDARVGTVGLGNAVQEMHHRPESFGAVLEEQQSWWLGLVVKRDKTASYAAARHTSAVGRCYHEALQDRLSASVRTRTEEELAHATGAVDVLQREVGKVPGSNTLLRRIRHRLEELTSEQIIRLGQELGPEHPVLRAVLQTRGIGRGMER